MKIWINYWLLSHNTDFEMKQHACRYSEIITFALLHYALEKYYNLRWKIITICIESFIAFCVNVITFCVSITFCGDFYYILC